MAGWLDFWLEKETAGCGEPLAMGRGQSYTQREKEGISMQEKTFLTGRGTIHYWVEPGPAEACTLVFLPGLTADHTLFDAQTAYFSGRYPILTWDAPGHGASRPFPLDFSLFHKAEWLGGILEQEQVRSFCLVGQSMGGYVAQCFLQRYPGRASGFVAIDSAPLKHRYVTAAELWALRHCEPIYRLYPWEALKRAAIRGCACTEGGRALMQKMMQGYTREEYCALAGHGYRMLAQAMAAGLPYEPGCPVLLLCGEQDRAASTRRYNRAWAKGEGLPLVWVPGAGHNSNTDDPQMVNKQIEDFVRRAAMGEK